MILIAGKRRSGKTCYLYLMIEKMIQKKLFGCQTLDQDPEIQDYIDDGQWIARSKRTTTLKELTRKSITMSLSNGEKQILFTLPDISGGQLEDIAKKAKELTENPLPAWRRIFKHSKDETEQLLLRLSEARGLILMTDMEDYHLPNSELETEQLNDCKFIRRLATVFSFYNGLDIGHQIQIPVLVVLNKSDCCYENDNEKYSADQSAEDFFCEHMMTANNSLINCFGAENIRYAWHSTTGRVIREDGNICSPDYPYFRGIDGHIYTKSFIELIERIAI
ncbi:hypothetical protein [Maridesulfovibrio sp.]|uniref:hypothetical protein n=1 Tax=Maridesulfovibrio sp. TaxID=2795000 RepID=UPI0029CAA760|nr:hypothetical protein [Maridesulfovibrio sp.]